PLSVDQIVPGKWDRLEPPFAPAPIWRVAGMSWASQCLSEPREQVHRAGHLLTASSVRETCSRHTRWGGGRRRRLDGGNRAVQCGFSELDDPAMPELRVADEEYLAHARFFPSLSRFRLALNRQVAEQNRSRFVPQIAVPQDSHVAGLAAIGF